MANLLSLFVHASAAPLRLAPSLSRFCALLLYCLLLPQNALAAEIEGLTESEAIDEQRQLRREELIGIVTGNDPDRTVLHFSVLPSLTDPNAMETRVYLQKRGAQKVCIAISSPDIITRGYKIDEGKDFQPEALSTLVSDKTNETGVLLGYNDEKLFIRPDDSSFTFDSNQCFTVGGFEGCFIEGDLACDEVLEDNEEVCLASGNVFGSCGPGVNHAEAIDKLLKVIAANSLQPPVVTEAPPPGFEGDFVPEDVFQAPEIIDTGSPFGPITGPTVNDVLPTTDLVGGGTSLVQVPDVRGQTEAEAIATIENARLVVKEVIVDDTLTPIILGSISLIRPAFAQDGTCEASKADRTEPPKGTFVEEFSPVTIILCADLIDVPEPASVLLFITGLLLLLVVYRCSGKTEKRPH